MASPGKQGMSLNLNVTPSPCAQLCLAAPAWVPHIQPCHCPSFLTESISSCCLSRHCLHAALHVLSLIPGYSIFPTFQLPGPLPASSQLLTLALPRHNLQHSGGLFCVPVILQKMATQGSQAVPTYRALLSFLLSLTELSSPGTETQLVF